VLEGITELLSFAVALRTFGLRVDGLEPLARCHVVRDFWQDRDDGRRDVLCA
jgi:hypothetical protein